ncbi:putative pwwp domain-containing protein [Rosellinia necatrix]|uniref:Putative pwwp domain-containing protein n=1 Tax=Rosellinia necatrix TaxID=77044 RepID=A0A1W2TDU5_ROSNE|nr:putative pwwp domain-containing protein [Rosellinia necatrix]
MSDDTNAQPAVVRPSETAVTANSSASRPIAIVAGAKGSEPAASAESGATVAGDAETAEGGSEDQAPKPNPSAAAKPSANEATTATDGDAEMGDDKPATEGAEPVADSEKAAEDADDDTNDTAPATTKSQPRRKSTGVADKGKKLNRKASRVKILHLDAKPGDHYFAKLKGFPPWPVVICEEDMLPQNMLNSRPVTAARPDGTYRDDFADGGKRAGDRTFPVMYLHTNEFSWTPNTDLSELDPATVGDMVTAKMRKDLQAAHALAAEGHDLDYYKNVLREFEEQRLAKAEAKKSKVKTPKKSGKAADEEGDVDMEDAEDEAGEPAEKKSRSKKRKAEEESSTPQRSDSVKKPKIKLTGAATPKTANGVQSPVTKDSAKPTKSKAKSSKGGKEAESKKEKEPAAPKEPELTPEERRARKEKEILFLRHRLQRGLLPREGSPLPDEMKQVSDFLAKLETFPDLDVSIIRVTKINKVLKAILKLDTIPKEEEFQFKPRSQTLLDKWNILLASDGVPAPTTGSSATNTNGVNGSASAATKSAKETTNGVKETPTDGKAESEKKNTPKSKGVEQEAEAEDKEHAADAEKTTEAATATTAAAS